MRISDWSSDVCSSDLALSPLMRSPAPDASRTAQPVVATVAVAPAPDAVDVELRAIDRALQAGLARTATDDALEAHGAQRQSLVAGNDGTAGKPQPRGLPYCDEDIHIHTTRTHTHLPPPHHQRTR